MTSTRCKPLVPHEDKTVGHHQIPALDEFNTHLLSQEGVLKVGRVVHTGCQHDHGGAVTCPGQDTATC